MYKQLNTLLFLQKHRISRKLKKMEHFEFSKRKKNYNKNIPML